MSEHKLVSSDDPILYRKMPEFDFNTPPIDPKQLHIILSTYMVLFRGVGLSACQLGLPYNAFVYGDYGSPENIITVFNPRIVDYSKETSISIEGCLSFPRLFIKIKRPSSIRFRFQDINGETHTSNASGLTARIIQHETDHCNGITFHERASKYHLEVAQSKLRKLK